MWPRFDSRIWHHMWVEFVVGSHPCSERFFSGYSGFPLSSKTNISKFQFDLDYCQALYHEPLARETVQGLTVLLTLNLMMMMMMMMMMIIIIIQVGHTFYRLCWLFIFTAKKRQMKLNACA